MNGTRIELHRFHILLVKFLILTHKFTCYFIFTTILSGNEGIPVKLLFEAEGMKVTVEVNSKTDSFQSLIFLFHMQ